jgi:hypothetical protein
VLFYFVPDTTRDYCTVSVKIRTGVVLTLKSSEINAAYSLNRSGLDSQQPIVVLYFVIASTLSTRIDIELVAGIFASLLFNGYKALTNKVVLTPYDGFGVYTIFRVNLY